MKAARNSAIMCAVFLAVIEGVGIGFQRMMAENTRLDVRYSVKVFGFIFTDIAATASPSSSLGRKGLRMIGRSIHRFLLLAILLIPMALSYISQLSIYIALFSGVGSGLFEFVPGMA
jgi:hypothetical protein